MWLASREGCGATWRGFFGWALPKSTYTSPTFRVDIGLNLLNLFLVPGTWLVEGLALEELDDAIVQVGHGLTNATPCTAADFPLFNLT